MEFLDAREASIRPLIDHLDFIHNKQSWGYPFRRGLLEVERGDMERIAAAMGVDVRSL